MDARIAALIDGRADNGRPRSRRNPERALEETRDGINVLSRGRRIVDEFDESRAVDAGTGPGERAPHRFRPARGEDRCGRRGRPDPYRDPARLDHCNAFPAGSPETRSRVERKTVG